MKHIEYESNRKSVIKEILKKKVFLLLVVCDSCIKLGDLIWLEFESETYTAGLDVHFRAPTSTQSQAIRPGFPGLNLC